MKKFIPPKIYIYLAAKTTFIVRIRGVSILYHNTKMQYVSWTVTICIVDIPITKKLSLVSVLH